MKFSTQNKSQGIIKSKSLVDLLVKKTEIKKELIVLKKSNKNLEKQEELIEEISAIDNFLSKHKIQK